MPPELVDDIWFAWHLSELAPSGAVIDDVITSGLVTKYSVTNVG